MSLSEQAAPLRLLHTMIRVADLDRSLAFYCNRLGMRLLRLQDFPEGAFTLAFVGYGSEADATVIELTHNWDGAQVDPGRGFGHLAIGVPDVHAVATALARAGVPLVRAAGPLKGDPDQVIAFIEDPDGYRIELIQVDAASPIWGRPRPAEPPAIGRA